MDPNLLRGTIPTLILSVLAEGPSYGYDISETIKARTEGGLSLSVAALYTTLKRMEEQGMIEPCDGPQQGARERRYYRVTDEGRTHLRARRLEWADFTHLANLVFMGGSQS